MKSRTKYERSVERIELIITYKCNRRCYNCEASVRQAPSNDYMTVEQIQKFVDESIEKQIKWKNIRVLGGEPTLHKDIQAIISVLFKYKQKFNTKTQITIVTNGTGKLVNTVIDELVDEFHINVQNSNKKSDIQPQFSPVNQAPIDVEEYKNMDFTKGCWITTACGIALDMYGYYPCSAAAATARVFGYDIGRKYLPEKSDRMDDLYPRFCSICGHYYNEINNLSDFPIANDDNADELEELINEKQKLIESTMNLKDEVISKTWREQLDKYKNQTPVMTRY